MVYIKELKTGLSLFKALSSDIRLQIIELLAEHDHLNLNDLAQKLDLTNGAITMHIKKLEESVIIEIQTAVGKHGIQKICYLNEDKLIVDLRSQEKGNNVYEVDIQVGHYSAYEVKPTCGMATRDKIIGEFDDPRYFADPQHIHADIIWLTEGYFEYRVPNYLKSNQQFEELQFIMEIGSEAPGYCNNWPSDIYVYVNDQEIGYWTSPGDFGGVKGTFNPDWWPLSLNQYGMLKMIRINKDGSFIDGTKVSDVTLNRIGLDYKSDIKLKLAVPAHAKNPHGLTLFGSHFGNYNQNITARVLYLPIN
jgi:predicted transcriptional regulator